MGTSKGYIAPSTPHWSKAKRCVSMYVSNPSETERNKAASKYARAMQEGGFNNNRAVNAVAQLTHFIITSKSQGYTNALHEIGRDDIISMSPEEALNELLLHFSNDASTIDDTIGLESISAAFNVLEIQDLEDLTKVNINKFIKEFVCQFAKMKFAQLFDKQIRNKCSSLAQANDRVAEMQDFIYYTIKQSLTDEILAEINPLSLSDENIIKNVLQKGFGLIEII